MTMARTTSFTLGAELEAFVRDQVDSGAYASATTAGCPRGVCDGGLAPVMTWLLTPGRTPG